MEKEQWKKLVQNKIVNKLNGYFMKYASNTTKLQSIKESEILEKNYISKLNPKLVSIIMSLGLNMLEITKNYRGRYGKPTCPRYHLETDTAEHILNSGKLKKWILGGQTHKDLRKNDHVVMQTIRIYTEKVIGITDNVMAR